jgi:hypothetical protein
LAAWLAWQMRRKKSVHRLQRNHELISSIVSFFLILHFSAIAFLREAGSGGVKAVFCLWRELGRCGGADHEVKISVECGV